MIAHTRPTRENETKVQRQNAWTLLCCGILLIPIWLMWTDGIGPYIKDMDLLNVEMLTFYYLTTVVMVVGAGVVSAFEAVRPGLQAVAVGLVIVVTAFWSTTILLVLLVLYFLVVVLWSAGGGRSSRKDPTYLPVLSSIGILSLILMYLWLLNAPMLAVL